MAWRNIWRNKKRTLIVIASIFFAVLLALVMRSMQIGSYDMLVRSIAESYTGFIQIGGHGFKDNQSIDLAFTPDQQMIDELINHPEVVNIRQRLDTYMLISKGDLSRAINVIGVDMEAENSDKRLSNLLASGTIMTNQEHGIMIGSGVAKYLNVTVGDSIVLYGQGLYGTSAAGIFPIQTIIEFPSPFINDRIAYLPLSAAQDLLNTEEKITVISIMLKDHFRVPDVIDDLRIFIPEKLDMYSWAEIIPGMEEALQFDNASGIIMLIILYTIVGLGVLGTILMMTLERTREISMCIALGMKRSELAFTVFVESVFISILGVIAGIAVSFPILYYFNHHPIVYTGEMAELAKKFNMPPILPVSLEISIFYNQALIVFVLAIFISLYPVIKIFRLKIIDGLKG